MSRESVCFFDVDHTITRGSTGKHFAFKAVRAGYIHPGALLSIPLFYVKYRFGNIGNDDLDGNFSSLRGVPKKELDELGEEVFRRYIVHDIYPGAESLIKSLQDNGTEVVIATSSLELIVRPLAHHLGIERVLAGTFEYKEGICTGRFAGRLFFGENKKQEALNFLSDRGTDPAECAFYSDSFHDLPLMKAVGRAVAVNPDLRLRRHARAAGWEIIRFR